jgi:ABC-2 type transport system permease protein
MTPIAPLGLMVGKMIPYGALAFSELCLILTIMRFVFRVPIHGTLFVLLLLSLSPPFLLTGLDRPHHLHPRPHPVRSLSTPWAPSSPPSFSPAASSRSPPCPCFFRAVSAVIPATYYMQIIRGIVLRGSDFSDLAVYAFVKLKAV